MFGQRRPVLRKKLVREPLGIPFDEDENQRHEARALRPERLDLRLLFQDFFFVQARGSHAEGRS